MSTSNQSWQYSSPEAIGESSFASWYAVQTHARHEKIIAQRLREQGVTTFLPMYREVHRWSDRRKVVELPLFSCYVFVRLLPTNEQRLRVLRQDGVFNFVGIRGQGTPIPDEQIDAVQTLISQDTALEQPSLSEDRTARADSRRSVGRRRGYSPGSQRGPKTGDFHRCDSEIDGRSH